LASIYDGSGPRADIGLNAFRHAQGGYGTVGVKDGKPFFEIREGRIETREIRYTARP